jgi:hypothetical protein
MRRRRQFLEHGGRFGAPLEEKFGAPGGDLLVERQPFHPDAQLFTMSGNPAVTLPQRRYGRKITERRENWIAA